MIFIKKGQEDTLGEKKEQWIFICMIYVFAVLLYVFAVSRMSVPVHLKVDEDLYLSLAKSFHHSGFFMKGYQFSNYNCILYSMLISIGYFFYNPETILFTMRLINVLVMCSALFPVFLLARRVLPGKKAVQISAVCLLIPDMIDTCYLMQEVLFYPVLMWCFYLVYRDLEDGRLVNRFCIWASVMMVVAFFVKTNGLILIAAYVILLLVCRNERKKAILKCLLVGGIWCGLTLLLEYGILLANGGHQGENHYASQIMALFPLGVHTVIAGLSGLLCYIVFFIFCTGILPVALPFIYRKEYSGVEQKFLLFCYMAIMLMIAEIVVTVFLTEEAGSLIPHKFLFRYFFGFGIPFLMFLLKISEAEWKGKRILMLLYGGTGIYIAGYYIVVKTGTRTAIMDSHITLLLENVNKYMLSGFPVYCALLFTIFSTGMLWWIWQKKKLAFFLKIFWHTMWISMAVLYMVNLFQHPYYSNEIVGGDARKRDFIAVANYLGKDDVKVYYLNDELDNNALLYGYIWQDYQWIQKEAEIVPGDMAGECVLVTAAGAYETIAGFCKVDLSTNYIALWIRTG